MLVHENLACSSKSPYFLIFVSFTCFFLYLVLVCMVSPNFLFLLVSISLLHNLSSHQSLCSPLLDYKSCKGLFLIVSPIPTSGTAFQKHSISFGEQIIQFSIAFMIWSVLTRSHVIIISSRMAMLYELSFLKYAFLYVKICLIHFYLHST